MGVDLRSLAKPASIRLEDLSGRVVAIDAYNALYQFLAIIRGEGGEYLRDSKRRVTSHISGLFYRNMNLLGLGIKPVYVFDGEPPSLKSEVIERRRIVKQVATQMHAEAIARHDLVAAKKFAQATSVLKNEMVDDAKKVLDLLGVPWIDAPSEGEATAAYLTIEGLADSAASQDYDSLLFGAKSLVRNITISGKRKLPNKPVYVNVEPEEVRLEEVTRSLGITREQLIDIGIILGTDFNPDGFEGIGPATALKYIKEYGAIENVPKLKEKITNLSVQAIREIFLNPEVTKPEHLNWESVDQEGLIRLLCEEHNFSRERITAALQRLDGAKKPATETLQRWFA